MINFKDLKGNIYGGITSGIIALPLALAFGVASGLGAAAGLWGSILLCLFASIFGGTPTQISGPTGPITVVVAAMVMAHTHNPKLVFMAILLSGIFQIIFGLLKIGKFVNFVPYPVISGFMSGIGAIIILLQLNPLVGIDFDGSPAQNLLHFFTSLNSIDFQSFLLGIITLGIVFFTPKKIDSKIPAPLIALVMGTVLSVILNMNVRTIGEIPASFPDFSFPLIGFSQLKIVIPLALTLAVLGAIDTLLTSLVADSLTKTKHNSNKELIGQGIGNIIVSLFGGLAGSGATMRTVINIKSGGNSRLSGIIHAIFLIFVVLCFAPVASKIPMAVLAGILIKVGVSIIDYKFLKILRAAPKSDLAVMFFVFMITVLDDLILAVGVGIVLSSVLFAHNISNQMNVNIKGIEPEEKTEDNESSIEEDIVNHIMVMHIKGVFFFGSASQVLARVEHLFDTRHVIIDCQSIKSFDISAVFALEEMILRLKDDEIKVSVVFNNRKLAVNLLRMGLIKFITKDNIFFDVDTAIEKAKQKMEC